LPSAKLSGVRLSIGSGEYIAELLLEPIRFVTFSLGSQPNRGLRRALVEEIWIEQKIFLASHHLCITD
jgi:hypothetical protein